VIGEKCVITKEGTREYMSSFPPPPPSLPPSLPPFFLTVQEHLSKAGKVLQLHLVGKRVS